MSRRPNLIPSGKLTIALPLPELTQLSTFLFSDLEGRVPQGAYQRFFVERIREYFSSRQIDLAPYVGTSPGVFVLSGDPAAVDSLRLILEASALP